MITVHKIKAPMGGVWHAMLPASARPLTVQVQRGQPQMWVLLDTDEPRVDRTFVSAMTGGDLQDEPERLHWIATVQMDHGDFVFHVFEAR